MHCPGCNMQNVEGSTHCAHCGQSLLFDPNQPPASAAQETCVEPQTCGLAVASLVMGILSFLCLPILLPMAIIFGIIALVKISKSQGQLKGKGFAIAGIAIPVVLVPILLAILMPALAKVKNFAQATVCSNNMKMLSIAMVSYADDYDDMYPIPEQWCDLLIQHASVSTDSLHCLSDTEGTFSYAMNENLRGLDQSKVDSQAVLLFEADLGKNGVGGAGDAALRHEKGGRLGCNIAFCDGRIEFVTEDRIEQLKWRLEP